ncbi:DUF2474 family protein [Luteibacter anthropi]|uniref:DUF2474 family protein n=1 Tax=Luteibacter anthropi TaxID=564369 RepID=A0A7X5UBB5_9GAMM|nr:DUF2474 family protein [Luteibacter anthropi]
MPTLSRWRRARWFIGLYVAGVVAVGAVALLFRLLMPR